MAPYNEKENNEEGGNHLECKSILRRDADQMPA